MPAPNGTSSAAFFTFRYPEIQLIQLSAKPPAREVQRISTSTKAISEVQRVTISVGGLQQEEQVVQLVAAPVNVSLYQSYGSFEIEAPPSVLLWQSGAPPLTCAPHNAAASSASPSPAQ